MFDIIFWNIFVTFKTFFKKEKHIQNIFYKFEINLFNTF